MPQYFFTFQFWEHTMFAILGSGLLYMQWGRSKLKAFGISDLLSHFELSEKTRLVLEMVIFIAVGTLVAMGVGKPSTVPQAFGAGLGWTGLAAKPQPGSENRNKGKK